MHGVALGRSKWQLATELVHTNYDRPTMAYSIVVRYYSFQSLTTLIMADVDLLLPDLVLSNSRSQWAGGGGGGVRPWPISNFAIDFGPSSEENKREILAVADP